MITFNYRREKSEITSDILRPVASIEFRSKDGVGIDSRSRLISAKKL